METDEKTVVVSTCNNLFEAEVIAGRLKAEGIESILRDRGGTGIYCSPYAFPSFYEVEVLEHDQAAAEALLKEEA